MTEIEKLIENLIHWQRQLPLTIIYWDWLNTHKAIVDWTYVNEIYSNEWGATNSELFDYIDKLRIKQMVPVIRKIIPNSLPNEIVWVITKYYCIH